MRMELETLMTMAASIAAGYIGRESSRPAEAEIVQRSIDMAARIASEIHKRYGDGETEEID